MATKENTSSTVTEDAKTFHYGMFNISDGIKTADKIEQASVFLASGIDGIGDMVASGDVSCDRLWGYLHLIEAAKALIDDVELPDTKATA